jgi:5'-nucleotidase
MRRRTFIRDSFVYATGLTVGGPTMFKDTSPDTHHLTLLYTNDVHSRIDPFPDAVKDLGGLGGASRRATMIKEIRAREKNLLLLDAGDMLQGTPYFNLFDGKVEIKTMTAMGYDAATLGNHDFDGGMQLWPDLQQYRGFQLLSANYDFRDTPLYDQVKPYQVFKKGPIKVGVFGLGVELQGLVPEKLYGHTRYLDPLKEADKVANLLKKEEGCHLVVCLSHLGYRYKDKKVSDLDLAAQSTHIDLIIGGHTHTLLKEPEVINNLIGKPVSITQMGWGGAYLGRVDIAFERDYKRKLVKSRALPI